MKISAARELMATTLSSVTAFSSKGIAAHLERESGTDADITAKIEEDLATRGLSLVVMASAGSVRAQTEGGAMRLNVLVTVAIYENPTVSASASGCGISSEDAIEMVVAALAGAEAQAGAIQLAESGWVREPLENGEIVNVVGFVVPVSVRRRS